MTELQKILCKLYFRDLRYSEYASGSQYTKMLHVSRTLNMLVLQGILKGLSIYLGFWKCQSSESVLETTLKSNFKFNYPRETLKKKICLECIWLETWIIFLALNNIQFLRVLENSLRNNAPPTVLSNILAFSLISPTLPTLVCLPCHPR